MARRRVALAFLAALTALALYLCYLLIAPFLKPIVFAVILAIIFYPLRTQLSRKIRNRNISAALSTFVVILLVALASVFLGRAIIGGLRDIYVSLAAGAADGTRLNLTYFVDRAAAIISRYSPVSGSDLRSTILTQSEKAIGALLAAATGVVGSVTSFVTNAFIAFFILFFFFRDGRSIVRRASIILPLGPARITRLFRCMKEILNAIVYGTLAIVAVQGALTGLAFWFLGLSSPALWGLVTGLCALLPIIGTAFVFLPAIGLLLLDGHWVRSVILLVWALAIVHPVDNLLRPYLIGERVRLSTLYVFFAFLGGLKAFGALGVFIGPLILAVTLALFRFLREEQRAGSLNFAESDKSHLRSRPIQTAVE